MNWLSQFTSVQSTITSSEINLLSASNVHPVLHSMFTAPFGVPSDSNSDFLEGILFGLGCFWGAERLFWQIQGVRTTAVGYTAGVTEQPTYTSVCTGRTEHAEVVLVVFDRRELHLQTLLNVFWQAHNPTQGMRQGNDIGTQYRSCIFCYDQQQLDVVMASKKRYQDALKKSGIDEFITTQIDMAGGFYYAETYHQQYLHKVPHGYCGLKGTGVCI